MGDHAVLVAFGSRYSKLANQAVLRFDREIRRAAIPGIVETVPGICSLLVRFDTEQVHTLEALEKCRTLLEGQTWIREDTAEVGRKLTIPAVYGGRHGPDLATLAKHVGCTQEALVACHSRTWLNVLCLGFSPGTAYLAELPEEYDVPRKETYSNPVPAGSVLVANRQTVFAATEIRTGWWRIATSPTKGFRPELQCPFLFSPGDLVRFEAISEEQLEQVKYSQPRIENAA